MNKINFQPFVFIHCVFLAFTFSFVEIASGQQFSLALPQIGQRTNPIFRSFGLPIFIDKSSSASIKETEMLLGQLIDESIGWDTSGDILPGIRYSDWYFLMLNIPDLISISEGDIYSSHIYNDWNKKLFSFQSSPGSLQIRSGNLISYIDLYNLRKARNDQNKADFDLLNGFFWTHITRNLEIEKSIEGMMYKLLGGTGEHIYLSKKLYLRNLRNGRAQFSLNLSQGFSIELTDLKKYIHSTNYGKTFNKMTIIPIRSNWLDKKLVSYFYHSIYDLEGQILNKKMMTLTDNLSKTAGIPIHFFLENIPSYLVIGETINSQFAIGFFISSFSDTLQQ